MAHQSPEVGTWLIHIDSALLGSAGWLPRSCWLTSNYSLYIWWWTSCHVDVFFTFFFFFSQPFEYVKWPCFHHILSSEDPIDRHGRFEGGTVFYRRRRVGEVWCINLEMFGSNYMYHYFPRWSGFTVASCYIINTVTTNMVITYEVMTLSVNLDVFSSQDWCGLSVQSLFLVSFTTSLSLSPVLFTVAILWCSLGCSACSQVLSLELFLDFACFAICDIQFFLHLQLSSPLSHQLRLLGVDPTD